MIFSVANVGARACAAAVARVEVYQRDLRLANMVRPSCFAIHEPTGLRETGLLFEQGYLRSAHRIIRYDKYRNGMNYLAAIWTSFGPGSC
jgi:hypothetical protein